jgi:hypothetical protein
MADVAVAAGAGFPPRSSAEGDFFPLHQRIELDYCTKCRGVWFDAGELELMFEAANLDASDFTMKHILALPEKQIKEGKRRCPLCKAKMRKVAICKEPLNVEELVRKCGTQCFHAFLITCEIEFTAFPWITWIVEDLRKKQGPGRISARKTPSFGLAT